MPYVIGLDLGQTNDPTAIAVLEQSRRPRSDRPAETETAYLCSHLERVPLGTSYTAIVARVAVLLRTPPLSGSALAIDQTGVGRPVVDMFRQAQLMAWMRPITITAGSAVTQDLDGFHVPKKELVSLLNVLLQFRRLRIAAQLPEAATLVKELQNFRVKITAAANETFGAWRDGTHDDLVLAVALAAWLGENSAIGWNGKIDLPSERGNTYVAQVPKGVFIREETAMPW